MNKKREIRKKRILLCKGAGLNESANAMQDLLSLQMLQRLKMHGFEMEGESLWICKMTCDRADALKIIQTAKKEKSLLLMKAVDAPDLVRKKRFGKSRTIPQMQLFLASSSRMLTYLIDKNASDFEILKDQDACRAVDLFWKEGKTERNDPERQLGK